MLPKKNPITTDAWKKLEVHSNEMKGTTISELFSRDSNRFEKLTFRQDKILVDFSKNIISEKTLSLFMALAKEVGLKEAISAMFSGDEINETESRSVLHTALRMPIGGKIEVKANNVIPDVHKVLKKIELFSNKVAKGEWKGFSGKPMKDIINIGIGGSDLGPAMVCEALSYYNIASLNTHFISNVDSTHLVETLKKVDPDTTLFIISSKTFTTQETMTNAFSARSWFLNYAGESDIEKHFVAVSTNSESVKKFGIDPENMFEFWDWVGGRYSVWSAIGLPIACSVGFENFTSFLAGAHSIDKHFQETPFEKNIPILMALISIWYVNFFGVETEAILPYNQYLDKLVDYLQQVTMESNGKKVDRNGEKVNYQTCPIIWGAPGTNGQHSFFQLIHQGTRMIPCDFIAAANSLNPLGDHHEKLLSNFLGQTNALMQGKTLEEAVKEMEEQGKDQAYINNVAPFRVFDGNKPSNTILMDNLSPYNLGSLLAIYEHKVFVQGIVWNIFSFDQWGVELGKQIAGKVLKALKTGESEGFDPSTRGLISAYKKMKNSNE